MVLLVLAGGPAVAAVLSPPRVYPTVEVAEQRRATGPDAQATGPDLQEQTNPQLIYHGGPVGVTAGTPKVYLVFWGSQWGAETPTGSLHFANDSFGVAPRLAALFAGLGTNGERWSGVMTQYCDGVASGSTFCPAAAPHVGYPTGNALAGVWLDTAAPVGQAVSYGEIANEALRAALHFGNTAVDSNRYAQYVIAFPQGTKPDGFNNGGGFCAYHGTVDDTSGPIAFTNFPYLPDMGKSCGENFVNAGTFGLLDGVTMVEGHEYSETITDQDVPLGWFDGDGQENADKCVWLSSGTGAARNVTFSTGTFAMQSTWSNDDGGCAISHRIFGLDSQPDDFALSFRQRSASVQPGDSIDVPLDAVVTSGPPETVALTLGPVSTDIAASLSGAFITTDGSVTLSLATTPSTPYGVYHVAVTATGSTTHTAIFSLSVTPLPIPIANGIELKGLSGDADFNAYYTIDVPAGANTFDVAMGDGTGDADLYVGKGAVPTDTDYFCRSRGIQTAEHCMMGNPTGTWFIRIVGATAFSNVTLKATYAVVNRVLTGTTINYLADVAGSQRFYWFSVPPGQHTIRARISHMTADADLYMYEQALPSRLFTLCDKPPKLGRHSESCRYRFTWSPPFTSYWYLGVYGIADYTNLRLAVKVR
jgi:serine protease